MTLATDGLLGGRWTVDGGLEMLPAKGSLASPDAFPGIATWRESASLESPDAFLFVVSLAKKS